MTEPFNALSLGWIATPQDAVLRATPKPSEESIHDARQRAVVADFVS